MYVVTVIPIKKGIGKEYLTYFSAQGEENAVLSRVIEGSHRFLKIKRNDTIVLSSCSQRHSL
jgi:mRNA degradation ribonuclease J1/J2